MAPTGNVSNTNQGELELSMSKKNLLLANLDQLPNFSGNDHGCSLGDFIEKFETLANYLNWDDSDKFFAINFKLQGEARKIVKVHNREIKNFEDVIRILKGRFTKLENQTTALQKFLNFKQVPGMSVSEFGARATELSFSAIDLKNCNKDAVEGARQELLKTMLLQNLAPEIRKGVVSREPESVDQVISFAISEEKGWYSIRDPFVLQSQVRNNQVEEKENFACAANVKSEDEINVHQEIRDIKVQIASLIKKFENASVKDVGNKFEKQIICFNCRQEGHFARNCNFGQSSGQDNSFQLQGVDQRGSYSKQNYGNNAENYGRGNYRGRGNGNYSQGRGNHSGSSRVLRGNFGRPQRGRNVGKDKLN